MNPLEAVGAFSLAVAATTLLAHLLRLAVARWASAEFSARWLGAEDEDADLDEAVRKEISITYRGTLLRRIREMMGVTPEQLATTFGWKSIARIAEIETNRETLDRVQAAWYAVAILKTSGLVKLDVTPVQLRRQFNALPPWRKDRP